MTAWADVLIVVGAFGVLTGMVNHFVWRPEQREQSRRRREAHIAELERELGLDHPPAFGAPDLVAEYQDEQLQQSTDWLSYPSGPWPQYPSRHG